MIVFKIKSPKVLYITGYPRTNEGNGNILTFKYIKERINPLFLFFLLSYQVANQKSHIQ